MVVDPTSWDHYRAFEELADSNPKQAVVEKYIPGVRQAFQEFLGLPLEQTAAVELYDWHRYQRSFVLRRSPVVSITDIRESHTGDFDDDSIIDAEDYELESEEGIVTFRRRPRAGNKSLRVDYTAGFAPDTATLLADNSPYAQIALAGYIQVKALVAGSDTYGRTSTSSPVGRRGVRAAGILLVPEVVELLTPLARGPLCG